MEPGCRAGPCGRAPPDPPPLLFPNKLQTRFPCPVEIQGAGGPFSPLNPIKAGRLQLRSPRLRIHGAVQPPASTLPESLSGLIERVTFFNEDNGFGVLQVKAKGHRDLVTVVGSLPSVSPGEWLTAQGRWVQDREYGRQFRAEMLTSTHPLPRPPCHRASIPRGNRRPV